MKEKFKEAIEKVGQQGVLIKNGQEYPVYCVIEFQNAQIQKKINLRGEIPQVKWIAYLFVQGTSIEREDLLCIQEKKYRIRKAHLFYYKEEPLYWKVWLSEGRDGGE